MPNQIDQIDDDQGVENLALLLLQLSERLKAGLHRIEPGFETLGNKLHTIYDDSEKLTKGIRASVDHIHVDSEAGLLHDVGKIVADSLSVLSPCRDFISGSLENVVACSKFLTRLNLACKRMKKNSDFLHILGLNVRVESSRNRLTTAMFKGFGDEIKSLAVKLGETTSAIHSNAEKMQTNQTSMQSRIPQNMESFDLLAVSTKKAVAHATEEIQSIGNQAAMILEKSYDHSLKISGIVGEIVMAIQFHDIARQQIEHIISGMEDILSILQVPAQENGGVWENDDQKRGGAYSILTIQAAQLKQVNSEAHRVYDNIETAFEQISKEVAQLINDVAGSGLREKGGIDVEKCFYSFQSKVENLYRLLVDADELESAIRKNMHDVSSAVPTLFQFTDVASDINVDLQYKALNAMIMTNKLGREGSAFGVLSRNVRDVSTDSSARVQDVVEIIKSITEASEKVSAVLDGLTGDDQIKGGLSISVGDCINNISAAFDEYKENCVKAAGLAQDMVEAIGETKQHLGFFPKWINECEQVFESVESLLDELSPWTELAANLPPGAKDDIAKRYTMESKHRVHQQTLAPQDDNIELF